MSDTPLFEHEQDDSNYDIKIRGPPDGESDATLPPDYHEVASGVAKDLSGCRNVEVEEILHLDSGSVLIRFTFASDRDRNRFRNRFYRAVYEDKSKASIGRLSTRSVIGVTGVTRHQRRKLRDAFAAALLESPADYLDALDISGKAYYLPSWIITIPFCLLTGIDVKISGPAYHNWPKGRDQVRLASKGVSASGEFLERILKQRDEDECYDPNDAVEAANEKIDETIKNIVSHLDTFGGEQTAEVTEKGADEWLKNLGRYIYRLAKALARIVVGNRNVFNHIKAVANRDEPVVRGHSGIAETTAVAGGSALIAGSIASTTVPLTQLGLAHIVSVALGKSMIPTMLTISNPVSFGFGVATLAVAGFSHWVKSTTQVRSQKAQNVLIMLWKLQAVYEDVAMLLEWAKKTRQRGSLLNKRGLGQLKAQWTTFEREEGKRQRWSKQKPEQLVYQFIRFYLRKVSETKNAAAVGDEQDGDVDSN